ncbi:MAG: S-layer homology domain-containing protein [Candidatus Peregrinibacteria bacterium]
MANKNSTHGHFLAILLLFAGFSLYAISSFFGSTNDYIDNMYVSVVDEGMVALDMSEEVGLFTDVLTGHLNAEAIGTLYDAGIVGGYDDGSFRPDNTINRAELLTVVTNAVDADFSGMALGNCFTDVHDEWFAVFICYAKDRGWVKGYNDGSYGPGRTISKAEAIKIVMEAFNVAECLPVTQKPYEDVEVDAWFAPYACAAKRDGLVASAGLFNADRNITRAEFVQVVYNLMVSRGYF